MNNKTAPRWLVLLAFAAIYLIWGSTYLGIGFAVQSMPPHIMAGVRFIISGAILYTFLRWRGVPAPKRIHWRSALIIGVFLLGLGNGSIAWAETTVPTGLAALLTAIVPLWMVLLEWLRPNGVKPRASVFVGIGLGLVGMLLLVAPTLFGIDHPVNLIGVLILMTGTISWAIGSIYSRQAPLPDSPLLLTGMEMLLGGVFLIGMSLVLGEWNRFSFAQVTTVSWLALAYLILIGSFLGFTAYVFLLQVTTPAKVSTYAYVNPVVAVFLGWSLNGEQITPLTLVASAVIVAGVATITYFNSRTPGHRNVAEPLGEEELVPRVVLDEPKTAHG
jgi:drug/metabolite transporter (DMT)-like permease